MSDDANPIHARRLLVALVLAALALSAAIIRPFWVAFFLAAVVTAALRPAMEWLARGFRGRRAAAAALLTFGVLVLVVLPIAALGTIVVNQVLEGIDWLRKTVQSEGIWGLVERLPDFAQRAVREVLDAVPEPQQELQKLAGEKSGGAAAAVGGAIAATGGALFQTAMMLIALFFLLADGQRLVRWIDARLPLRPGQFRKLVEDFRQTSVSVLVATIGAAAIQSVVAVAGYAIARAPNLLFLGLTTFVVALVPALGAAVAVAVVALIFLATGHPGTAVFLGIWAAVVSIADHVARPYFMKGGMALHGGVVFFALLGGLAAFGGIGLLVGPLVVTFLLTTVKLYRSEFGLPPPGDKETS
ncbi:MAG TPA: AI-2E family transporter [Anaeromyxobacter sp.]